MAGQRDAWLGSVGGRVRRSSRSRAEGGRCAGQAPGDAHQRVAVVGQPGAADLAACGRSSRTDRSTAPDRSLSRGAPAWPSARSGACAPLNAAARMAATPGRVVRICPAVWARSASSWCVGQRRCRRCRSPPARLSDELCVRPRRHVGWSAWESVSEVDLECCAGCCPGAVAPPLGVGFEDGEVDEFGGGLFVGEVSAGLDRLADLAV